MYDKSSRNASVTGTEPLCDNPGLLKLYFRVINDVTESIYILPLFYNFRSPKLLTE